MSEETEQTSSSFGCGPAIGAAVAAFSLMLGVVIGVTGLYAYLAMSDDGLEQLRLAEPIDEAEFQPPEPPAEPTVYALAHPLGDTFQIQEGLDDEQIRRRFVEDRRLFQQCYDEELQRSGDTEGEIVFQFTVDTDGDVVAAVTRDNRTGSEPLSNCVTSSIRSDWSFEEPDIAGVATVRFHVLFIPVDTAV